MNGPHIKVLITSFIVSSPSSPPTKNKSQITAEDGMYISNEGWHIPWAEWKWTSSGQFQSKPRSFPFLNPHTNSPAPSTALFADTLLEIYFLADEFCLSTLACGPMFWEIWALRTGDPHPSNTHTFGSKHVFFNCDYITINNILFSLAENTLFYVFPIILQFKATTQL